MGLEQLKLKRTKLAPLDGGTAEASRPSSHPTDPWLSVGRVQVDGLRNKL